MQIPQTSPPSAAAGSLRGHIREFDGLRGIAIALVMLHHFWPSTGPLAALSPIAHLGWVGVDLFFVISGCLIAGILLDTRGAPGALKNFYARRVIRIFPLYYLVVFGAFVGIPILQGSNELLEQSGSPWWYLLYAGNIREALLGHEPAYVLAVTWSLSIEEQFYVLFPLAVILLSRARLAAVLWTLVVAAPLFRTATALLWPENERIQYLATPSRVDVLALGCLIALAARGHARVPGARLTRLILPGSILACAIAFLVGGLDRTTFFGRTFGYSLVGAAAFALVLWVSHRRGTRSLAWLRIAPLCGLGVVCYGAYLLHRPVQVIVGKLAERLLPEVPLIGTTLGLVVFSAAGIAAATLSWFLVERPILRWKRRFELKGHPEAPAVEIVGGVASIMQATDHRPATPHVSRFRRRTLTGVLGLERESVAKSGQGALPDERASSDQR